MLESIFKLTVIFFGLTNLSVTFQTIINDLLRDMIEAKDVAIFINDVIIKMETKKEYDDITKEMLRRIVENDSFVKLEKYMQNVRKVEILEVIIEPNRVKMMMKKVQRVLDWPVPISIKNVQKFLRLTNYYRQFVKDFVRVVKSLHEMTRKDIKQNQKEKQQKTFEKLKEIFTTEPVSQNELLTDYDT